MVKTQALFTPFASQGITFPIPISNPDIVKVKKITRVPLFLDESHALDIPSPQPEEVLDFGELNCDQCGKVNAVSVEL